ncbi:MAG: OmpA family protein, partial [Novosphingobium sp.]|nr:OmpA family protein [Novosphingobium sp.]
MNRIVVAAVLLANACLLSGCAGKSAREASAMPAPGGTPTRNAADYDAEGNYIGPGSQTDLRRFAGSDRVFFDLDSHALDEEDRDTLRKHAAWMAKNTGVHVSIEGHCDERGTRDYNLALGER